MATVTCPGCLERDERNAALQRRVAELDLPRVCPATSEEKIMLGKETKIFDPADGFAPLTDALVLTDSSVVKRGNRWWM